MNAKIIKHLVEENKKLREAKITESCDVEQIDSDLMGQLEKKEEDFDAEEEFNYL